MRAYSDKIDASYAKLKTVLAEAVAAAKGFKSSLPDKKNVRPSDLSNEIVSVLLDGIQRFIMHLTSASIDQVSGRLEEKLKKLGVGSLSFSDEAIQQIMDVVSAISPDAASPSA